MQRPSQQRDLLARGRRSHYLRCFTLLTCACWLVNATSGQHLAEDGQVQEAAADEPAVRRVSKAALIEFTGEIHSLSEQYLYRKLDAAEKQGAGIIVIEIDSPGGDVEATMRIAERLRDLRWAKTVAFVPREALSGAALFSLGCDEIVMAPQAVLGDAGPIFLDEDFLFKHASEKVRSHLARQVRDLATAKGRPPALAEAMVDMNLVVYEVSHGQTGETAFMSDAEINASADPAVWKKVRPVLESRQDHFLEVNGARAVELHLAEGVAANRNALRQRYEPVDEWIVLEWSKLDTAVMVLNHPFVTGIIFVIGLVALYIELAAPGLGIGGVTALVCFVIFFWSRFLGGTAEWLDVILFVTGCGLLVVEFFVIPGFGIWGIGGAVLVLAAMITASQPFLLPRTQQELGTLTRNLAMLLISAAAFTVVAGMLARRMGSIPGLRRLQLQPPVSVTADAAEDSPTEILLDGCCVRVGDRGIAESQLRPAGRIRIGNDYVDVVSDGSFVEPQEAVEVINVRGNRVVVRKVS